MQFLIDRVNVDHPVVVVIAICIDAPGEMVTIELLDGVFHLLHVLATCPIS